MLTSGTVLRLGTRGSPLARWQADYVSRRLEACGARVQLVPIKTSGDVTAGPIGGLANQGVFTKEIQRALLDGRVDLAVHSLKDLPTESIPGLVLAAVPPRGPAADVLVSAQGQLFTDLPPGSRVGTGSIRRQAQVRAARSDLQLREIRGNVETRLEKLQAGQYDALILAEAGLHRLDLAARITQVLSPQIMLPAVGQGALGLETRADDEATLAIVQQLNDESSFAAITAERAMLAALRGGCLAPVAAWARPHQDRLALEATVLSLDGQTRLDVRVEAARDSAHHLGESAAGQLLAEGAADLIARARGE